MPEAAALRTGTNATTGNVLSIACPDALVPRSHVCYGNKKRDTLTAQSSVPCPAAAAGEICSMLQAGQALSHNSLRV